MSDGEGGGGGSSGPFPWIRHWLWVQYNKNSSKGMSKIHQRSEGTLTDAKKYTLKYKKFILQGATKANFTKLHIQKE